MAHAGHGHKEGGIPLSWIIGAAACFMFLSLVLVLLRLANRQEEPDGKLAPGAPRDRRLTAVGARLLASQETVRLIHAEVAAARSPAELDLDRLADQLGALADELAATHRLAGKPGAGG